MQRDQLEHFSQIDEGRKIGSWKPNVVEIAKHRGASALSPERMTGSEVFLRGWLRGKRVEVGGDTVTGVSGSKRASVPHTILCNSASDIL